MDLRIKGVALAIAFSAITTTARAAELPGRDWQARARDGLAAREYWASESEGRLQAPNRAHALRTWFDTTGVRVHDRAAPGTPKLIGLSLAGVGRGAAMPKLQPGRSVTRSEGRVEIDRPGVVEWYVNAPSGLEQGFTLTERPAGAGPLFVDVAIDGARPTLSAGAIDFETRGRRLRFGKLEAVDATGRALTAHFALPSPQRLRIVVDDAGAVFPVVVDPLLESIVDAQLEANQAAASFGWSVAGAGDVNGDGFDDVIVGAIRYDAGQADEGAAFVFHGSAAGLGNGNPTTAAARLESNQINAFLGWSVDGAGDVNGDGYDDVVVGARSYTAGQTGEGAAFVFLGSASGVGNGDPTNAAAQIEANLAGAQLGYSVAGGDVNGDGYGDVIAGTRNYASGQSAEGAAFVFLGSASGIGDGNPSSAAAVLQSDQASANFATSVDTGDVNGDGYDDVIVGAPNYDAGQSNEGAAFVFLGSASGVASGNPGSAATQIEGEQANAALGTAVASAGDVNGDGYDDVIVGAISYDAGQTNEGAAFIFHGSAAGIADATAATAATQLESNTGATNFGASVAGAGDANGDGYGDVLVGAPNLDGLEIDEGGAFLFAGSAAGVANAGITSAEVSLRGGQLGALMGQSVAGVGDVNGDGGADVAVGVLFFDGNPEDSDEGGVFVYHGVPAPEPGSGVACAVAVAALAHLRRARSASAS